MAANDNFLLHIGRYSVDITEEIGRGTFGTVYKAYDESGKLVAAKELSSEEHKGAAIKEVLNFCNIPRNHKNILDTFSMIDSKNDYWIFMDYCEHGNLNKYFKEHYPMLKDNKVKLKLMEQIGCGTEFLHSENIIHRDIKPENLLVTGNHDPNYTTIKICDFGLARFLDPNDDTSGMTTDVGSAMYKAPEFWKRDPKGRIRYHRSVDIFAAGLTFLAMLQAKQGEDLKPILDTIQEYSRNPIGLVMFLRERQGKAQIDIVIKEVTDDSLTLGIKELIKKMTNVVPEYRPTAGEVRRLLDSEMGLLQLQQVLTTYI